ncbi:uncharacterized protein CLUP02_14427 [Colletotrichum lupini]|uniref:Uncharacterized protein n=1 Tax=Colletotrichum lupini TaxID=145971 RepID=A0A9Q8T4Z1_9PEZI|nr:uncharacterized protein CLUP02_14427 [Colletotrichum lupini]UQC88900.1 hypothetical protein CLUP02_14427 [Colletotrichum lupini]
MGFSKEHKILAHFQSTLRKRNKNTATFKYTIATEYQKVRLQTHPNETIPHPATIGSLPSLLEFSSQPFTFPESLLHLRVSFFPPLSPPASPPPTLPNHPHSRQIPITSPISHALSWTLLDRLAVKCLPCTAAHEGTALRCTPTTPTLKHRRPPPHGTTDGVRLLRYNHEYLLPLVALSLLPYEYKLGQTDFRETVQSIISHISLLSPPPRAHRLFLQAAPRTHTHTHTHCIPTLSLYEYISHIPRQPTLRIGITSSSSSSRSRSHSCIPLLPSFTPPSSQSSNRSAELAVPSRYFALTGSTRRSAHFFPRVCLGAQAAFQPSARSVYPKSVLPKAQVKTKTPTAHACPYIDTFFAQRSRHLEINHCNLAGGPPAVAAAPTTAPSPSWKYSSSSDFDSILTRIPFFSVPSPFPLLPHPPGLFRTALNLLKPAGYNRRDPTTHVPHTHTLLRLYIQIHRLETAVPVALAVAARCLRRRYRSSTLVRTVRTSYSIDFNLVAHSRPLPLPSYPIHDPHPHPVPICPPHPSPHPTLSLVRRFLSTNGADKASLPQPSPVPIPAEPGLVQESTPETQTHNTHRVKARQILNRSLPVITGVSVRFIIYSIFIFLHFPFLTFGFRFLGFLLALALSCVGNEPATLCTSSPHRFFTATTLLVYFFAIALAYCKSCGIDAESDLGNLAQKQQFLPSSSLLPNPPCLTDSAPKSRPT